ncbi:MAG: DUF2807 domain-containing protein [Anaerolineae bacterium]|jgi:hypothetical protein|nr:DUF2807 domain-containing protein [Anaerolineae bacterium]
MAEQVSERRELGEFNRIAMRGVGKMFINQGKEQSVVIEGDKIGVSRISTNVSDGRLVIDIGRDWVEKISAGFDFISNDILIKITLKDLRELEVTGAADIEVGEIKTDALELKLIGASNLKVTELKADSLKTEIPGAGKVQVEGKVKDQSVTLAGAGNFSGYKLESETAKVVLSGVGSAQLWVKKELDATIAGVGSVEYYGNPTIKQSVAMLGKITCLGDPK